MKVVYTILVALLISFQNNYAQDQSLYFDGVDDYCSVVDFPNLGTSNFTIEFWFSVNTFTNVNSYLISKGASSHGIPPNAGFQFYFNDNGGNNELVAAFNTVSWGYLLGLNEDTWYHVALVRSDTAYGLYVNCTGMLISSPEVSSINVNTNLPFTIGAHEFGGFVPTNNFADARIDEIRVWNVARSQAQICDWMNCTIDVPVPGLVAVYNMDDSSGLTLADNSGFNAHGELFNGPTWSADAATLADNCLIFANQTEEKNEFCKVYPNPANHFVSIQLTSFDKVNRVEIYNNLGELVLSETPTSNEITIPISQWAEGIYFVKAIGNSNQIITTRFAVIR